VPNKHGRKELGNRVRGRCFFELSGERLKGGDMLGVGFGSKVDGRTLPVGKSGKETGYRGHSLGGGETIDLFG